tara:strand:+ start:3632 stop:4354 length:723 start_codon:yes stop_codon:yes gene_type:complete
MSTDYLNLTVKLLKKIHIKNHKKFLQAAKYFYNTYKKGGLIYIFGTGHSHLLALDGHYRAGGLAAICPILDEKIMLHKNAIKGSVIERTPGVSKKILKKYPIKTNDTFLVFSNSGVNHAPIEAANYALKKGCKVIGISSSNYARIAPVSKIGKKLNEVCSLHIDNFGPPGDALIAIKKNIKVSAFSTIAGSFILNSIIKETAKIAKKDKNFPFYISSNMPNAKNNNYKLLNKYKKINPHL